MSNVPDSEPFTVARWPRLAQAGRGGDVPGLGLRFPLAIAYVQGRLTPSGVAAIEALMALDELTCEQVAAAAADHQMHLLLPRLIHRASQYATRTTPVRSEAGRPVPRRRRRSPVRPPAPSGHATGEPGHPLLSDRPEPRPDQPAEGSTGDRLAATCHDKPTVRRKKPRASALDDGSPRVRDDAPTAPGDQPPIDAPDDGSPEVRDVASAMAQAPGGAELERCAHRLAPAVRRLTPLTDSPTGQPWRCELPRHEGLVCTLRIRQGDLLAEVEGDAPQRPGARPTLILFGPDGLIRFEFTLRPLANGRTGDVRCAGPWRSLAQRLGHGQPLALWLNERDPASALFHSRPAGPPPPADLPPPLL